MLFEGRVAPYCAVGELHFHEGETMFTNRIVPCVSQQLHKYSVSSFFQSALPRCWQPFSVISLYPKYKLIYEGISISGTATLPSLSVHNRYLRFCYVLIYPLITKVEVSQSAEVYSAEGDTSLLSDVVSICV